MKKKKKKTETKFNQIFFKFFYENSKPCIATKTWATGQDAYWKSVLLQIYSNCINYKKNNSYHCQDKSTFVHLCSPIVYD